MEVVPDNFELSKKRLIGLLKYLRQNWELFKQYDRVIRSQLEEGIVRVESPEKAEGDQVHYLPLHAVIKHDKDTTKVQIVYDASAKMCEPSLNECLHVGPKFNQKILKTLLQFRTYRTAFVADIEKAFLMVSVNVKDRDALTSFGWKTFRRNHQIFRCSGLLAWYLEWPLAPFRNYLTPPGEP